MREIKFRAYDLKKKIIFPVHKIDFNKINQSIEFIQGYDDWDKDGYTVYGGGNMEYANKDRYILMQFTGLKDKNGKEIYEGDIIKSILILDNGIKLRTNIDIVEWNNEECSFMLTNNIRHFHNNLDLEIIGNIYDNPDLLKEE